MAGVSLVMDGKVALITGGSRGIGAETVRLFAAAGARVAFSYRQASEQAQALVAECGGPKRCAAVEQELRSPADGRALVAATVAAFGRLDILVANHGIWPAEDAPIELMTEEQWRNTLAVNLDSVFGLVQAAVAQMRIAAGAHATRGRRTEGHIVLISSTAGQRGEANHADYAVTKGALISLTKSLSSELAPRGIRGELCRAGLGGDGHVGGNVGRCGPGSEDRGRNSGGTGGNNAGDCGAGAVFVYAAGGVHLAARW